MCIRLRTSVKKIIPVAAFLLLTGLLLSRVFQPSPQKSAQLRINATEASEHIGTTAEVCGRVESAVYLPSVNGQPTFLNFEKDYPDQVFTTVIWGENRSRWDTPPHRLYENRMLCVTGRIELHDGTPQIVVTSPRYIEPNKPE